jgi:hypothetical protein
MWPRVVLLPVPLLLARGGRGGRLWCHPQRGLLLPLARPVALAL